MSLDKSLSLVYATKPALVDRKIARYFRMNSSIQMQIEILEKAKAGYAGTWEKRCLPKWY
jgi:hypothetical protein